MGAIGGLLGTAGGVSGTGISGPEGTKVITPVSQAQADEQYKNVQQALQQQQAFVQATQGQGGLGNQSQVYNQLQGVASGTGPNPAQAMLANATGANVANQAALMAGQRGSNANVGLLARQAAMQGANTQQQAAGQAAALQAQQSLNALQGAGNMANTQAAQQQAALQGFSNAAQGAQSNILNSFAGVNQANVGMQGNINSANAGLAGAKMGQQGQFIGNIAGGIGSAIGMAEGGPVPMYAEGDVVQPGGTYAPIDPNAPDVFDPKNASSIAPAPTAVAPAPAGASPAAKGPKSNIAKHFQAISEQGSPQDGASMTGQFLGKAIGSGLKSLFMSKHDQAQSSPEGYAGYSASGFSPEQMSLENSRAAMATQGGLGPAPQMAKGGKVPALVSPGEQYLPPKDVKKVAKDGENPLEVGERIPGKAKVKGNSYANDTVPKTLEAGGIVIPKSVMESKNPAKEAQKFVAAILAKHGKQLPKKSK